MHRPLGRRALTYLSLLTLVGATLVATDTRRARQRKPRR